MLFASLRIRCSLNLSSFPSLPFISLPPSVCIVARDKNLGFDHCAAMHSGNCLTLHCSVKSKLQCMLGVVLCLWLFLFARFQTSFFIPLFCRSCFCFSSVTESLFSSSPALLLWFISPTPAYFDKLFHTPFKNGSAQPPLLPTQMVRALASPPLNSHWLFPAGGGKKRQFSNKRSKPLATYLRGEREQSFLIGHEAKE